MFLGPQTRLELLNLIDMYKTKIIDFAFLRRVIDIINQEPFFSGRIAISSNDNLKSMMETDFENKIILINIAKIQKVIYNPHNRRLFSENIALPDLYYFDCLFFLLHEVFHIIQVMYGKENISEYPEINNLYKKLFSLFQNQRDINRYIYLLFHEQYCFERHANISALKELITIYEGMNVERYAKRHHFDYLFNNSCCMKKGRVISPVERTFHYYGKKEELLYYDLPFDVLFEHGFMIKEEDYHMIYGYLLDKNNPFIDYDEAIGKIKCLSARYYENHRNAS